MSYAFRRGAESVRRNGSRNIDCILAQQTEELDAMSDIATIAELSTWANMRLASCGSPVDDILRDITEGETMKLLLESEQQIYSFRTGEFHVHVCYRTYRIIAKKARFFDGVSVIGVFVKQRSHCATVS